MAKVIVPAGMALGWQHGSGYLVQLGGTIEELDEWEHAAWAAAHDSLDRHTRLDFDRSALRSVIHSGASAVGEMVDRGLLTEYDPVEPERDLLRRYRLLPTAEGMGNTADRPDLCRIGRGDLPYLAVPPGVFALWAYSYTCGSMWDGCVHLADGDARTPPDRLGRQLAAHVPALVASMCAFLDTAS